MNNHHRIISTVICCYLKKKDVVIGLHKTLHLFYWRECAHTATSIDMEIQSVYNHELNPSGPRRVHHNTVVWIIIAIMRGGKKNTQTGWRLVGRNRYGIIQIDNNMLWFNIANKSCATGNTLIRNQTTQQRQWPKT